MVKGLKIGVTLAREFFFMGLGRGNAIFQKAQRIAVPAGNIEIGTQIKMVKIGDPSHVIVGNRTG